MSTSYQNGDIESIDTSLELAIEQKQQESFGLKGKIVLGISVTACTLALGAFISTSSPISSSDISKHMMEMNWFYASNYGGSTSSNANSHELIYLDRHDINCGNNPINQFKMNPDVSYHFQCLSMAHHMPMVPGTHHYYDNGYHEDHNLIYFDRQHVSCPSDTLMTRFYGRNSGGNFGYGFACAKYEWQHLSCSTHHTGYNEATDKSIVYLDRHDVQCPYSQGLQSFRGQSSGGQIRYEYTCCAIYQRAPTAAPIASPTHSPTDQPTFAPTMNETPLVCPVSIDSSNKYFSKKLPSGCAMIALNDIEIDPESKAIIACGKMALSKHDLEHYGVKKGIDDKYGRMKKGRSISYLQVGKNIQIDYFASEDHSGPHDTFSHGDEPIRGHLVDGVDMNDHIKSLKLEVTSKDGLVIPSKCSDMEIFA